MFPSLESCQTDANSKGRVPENAGAQAQPAGVLIFQILAILFLFRALDERYVRTYAKHGNAWNP